jgi:hypothetical protein
VRLRVSTTRPFCHVVSTTNTHSAIVIGNQPPWKTFVRLAEKNARSTIRKLTAPPITIRSDLPHRKRTTKKNRIVSIASVPVTAMP